MLQPKYRGDLNTGYFLCLYQTAHAVGIADFLVHYSDVIQLIGQINNKTNFYYLNTGTGRYSDHPLYIEKYDYKLS